MNSDSEDEAFQSADEGEESEQDQRPTLKPSQPHSPGQTEGLKNQNSPNDNINKADNDAASTFKDEVSDNSLPISEAKKGCQLTAVSELGSTPGATPNDNENTKEFEDKEVQNQTSSNTSNESTEVMEEAVRSNIPESVEIIDNANNTTAEMNTGKDKSIDIVAKDEDLQQPEKAEVINSPIAQAIDRLTMTVDETKDTYTKQENASSASSTAAVGWGWGGWGDMLSKATSSVSSMIETVETQIGIPNPVEMARNVLHGDIEEKKTPEGEGDESESTTNALSNQPNKSTESDQKEESDKSKSDMEAADVSSIKSWFSGLGVSKISTLVQNTGKDFVSGSLDALEFVGKKTMDVISKGDPGFRHSRTTLSQALREAKQKAENKDKDDDTQKEEHPTFSVEFDRFQGLAHLEALEMISHESETEIEKILVSLSEEAKKDNENLFDILEKKFEESVHDDDESEQNITIEHFEEIIIEQMATLSLNVNASKLLAFSSSSNSANLEDEQELIPAKELYSKAVTDFAHLTACSVEFFHKVGELMLLPDVKASFLVKSRTDSLRKICDALQQYVTALSTRYATLLNGLNEEKTDQNEISKLITDVYLEASNSSSYINDSYRLLLPIFQFTAFR